MTDVLHGWRSICAIGSISLWVSLSLWDSHLGFDSNKQGKKLKCYYLISNIPIFSKLSFFLYTKPHSSITKEVITFLLHLNPCYKRYLLLFTVSNACTKFVLPIWSTFHVSSLINSMSLLCVLVNFVHQHMMKWDARWHWRRVWQEHVRGAIDVFGSAWL